jgi:hypothetical protein
MAEQLNYFDFEEYLQSLYPRAVAISQITGWEM